ncbi:aminotransferase class I/II-fold pyridoxal phosphate-dependent enzyme [Micromonosporaceae bacterium DT55]|uniref:aminotransferase class I/II-fold pyridoxal phosphate-dependent enzyme n=1 Tax=Melissospora conviva TaxID=3388432 RepID=UPI003C2732F5
MAEQYQVTGRSAAEISASVESGIRDGHLPGGAALPPVRALAADLDVSPGTVAKAYQELRLRGLVATAGRNGTRVRPRPPVAATRAAAQLPVPADALDLASGEPDTRLLPPLSPHLAALAAENDPPRGYADVGVLPAVVDAARARLAADGVPAQAVTVTSGALDGIERLLTARLAPGDAVGVEDPGWGNLLDLVAALGLTPVGVPVDDEGPTVAGVRGALAAGVRALIVTARAQNPYGAAISAARARALRDLLAGAPELLLIEDDHAAELATETLHPLAGATGSWAFLRSASKPYGPDLRLAVLAGDAATVARVAGRMSIGSGWVSTVLQRLALRLWSDPAAGEIVAGARRSYAERREGLLAALRQRGVPAHGRSGINIWVPVADETHAVAALRDAGFAVAPGARFRLGAPAGIRITVSRLDPARTDALAEAVRHAFRPATPRGFTT